MSSVMNLNKTFNALNLNLEERRCIVLKFSENNENLKEILALSFLFRDRNVHGVAICAEYYLSSNLKKEIKEDDAFLLLFQNEASPAG